MTQAMDQSIVDELSKLVPQCTASEIPGMDECDRQATHAYIWHHRCRVHPICLSCYDKLMSYLRAAVDMQKIEKGFLAFMCQVCREEEHDNPLHHMHLEVL